MAYVVGGFVRDQMRGERSRDVDVVVQRKGIEFGKAVARALKAHYHVRHEGFESGRIVWTHRGRRWQIDVSTIKGRTIHEDLAKRDFTVNALALPVQGSFRDAWKRLEEAPRGRIDAVKGWLRPVSASIFRKDPVRLLRAARFAVENGLVLTPALNRLAVQEARRIRRGTKERLCEEWSRILLWHKSHRALKLLDQWGVLAALFPELTVMKKVGQSLYHHLDVWDHTMEVVRWVDRWPELLKGFPEKIRAEVERYLEQEVVPHRSTKTTVLKTAALFHDVKKPQTKKIMPDGKITFYGHDKKGARVAHQAARWLKMSHLEVKSIERIVGLHLRPGFLRLPERGVSIRGAMKFFREAGDDVTGILLFSLADRWAARGPKVTKKILARTRSTVKELFDLYLGQYQRVEPIRLITGTDVMKACGLAPGPLVGKTLEAVREAQLAGEILTRREALALAKDYIRQLMVSPSPLVGEGKG